VHDQFMSHSVTLNDLKGGTPGSFIFTTFLLGHSFWVEFPTYAHTI